MRRLCWYTSDITVMCQWHNIDVVTVFWQLLCLTHIWSYMTIQNNHILFSNTWSTSILNTTNNSDITVVWQRYDGNTAVLHMPCLVHYTHRTVHGTWMHPIALIAGNFRNLTHSSWPYLPTYLPIYLSTYTLLTFLTDYVPNHFSFLSKRIYTRALLKTCSRRLAQRVSIWLPYTSDNY
jgi:hypothetical protein